MGRMSERKGFIGTSYTKAAKSIVDILMSRRIPNVAHIPFFQYILTRMVRFLPDKIFYKIKCSHLNKNDR